MSFIPTNNLQRKMVSNSRQMSCMNDMDRSKFDVARLDAFTPSTGVKADDPRVQVTAQEQAEYEKANRQQVEKNPHLAVALNDPKAFFNDLEGRFNEQKKLTPEDPYKFDFSDYGIPVLQDLHEALGEEIGKVGGELDKLNDGAWLLAPLRRGKVKEHETGVEYLSQLKGEIEGHLESGSVNYRRLQELGNFCSRALGHFDKKDLSFFDRNFLRVDNHLLGYEQTNIAEEQRRYQDNEFILATRKPGDQGIRAAFPAFESAFFNTERFEMASLPTAKSLGPGVFMRLMPHKVYVMGIAKEPEAADGFNRPGGNFWLHDIRHSASIFSKRKVYEAEFNLSQPQIDKLEKMTDRFQAELNAEKAKIKDKEMRYAIGFVSFNLHHDRGLPKLPSSFIPDDNTDVTKYLYKALKLSNQPTGFDKPKETIESAYKWLQDFWLARLPQEEAVLALSQPQA